MILLPVSFVSACLCLLFNELCEVGQCFAYPVVVFVDVLGGGNVDCGEIAGYDGSVGLLEAVLGEIGG